MSRVTPLKKNCEYCNEQFETLDYRKKFCNHSCAATFSNIARGGRPKKPRVRGKTKIQQWLDGEWDGSVRWGLSTTVRRYVLEQAGYKCSKCGWSGVNPVSGNSTVQVDHIDGNPHNNSPENLKALCPNCHSLTPTYGALNKGRGRKYRYNSVLV